MQEVIAFVYAWPPDVLDDLTLDELEHWEACANRRIEFMTATRCAFR